MFSWKLILGFNGVMNSALISVGLIQEPLTFLLYNEFAVVLTLAHAWAPFAILPIYVSLQKIDRSLLEAATDLGCSKLERFVRVTLPLTVPGIIAACLIIFIPTVGDYVTPALVGGSQGKMVANLIQVQFGAANNWPLGATLSLLAMLSVGCVAILFVVVVTARGAEDQMTRGYFVSHGCLSMRSPIWCFCTCRFCFCRCFRSMTEPSWPSR